MHDVYGNAITPTWDTSHRVSSVAQTVDDAGSTRTRTVSFTYGSGSMLPSTMTYNSRTWTYTFETYNPWRLLSAQPPAGPAWGFVYGSNALTVTTPSGGTVAYGFQTFEGRAAVQTITYGGPRHHQRHVDNRFQPDR